MPILRLAYSTQFLIALIAIFVLWSEVGGQSHLDLLPWYLKLALGGGAAFSTVKATATSVAGATAWNLKTLKWLVLTVTLLTGCALTSYYAHLYLEEEEPEQGQDNTAVSLIKPDLHRGATEAAGNYAEKLPS